MRKLTFVSDEYYHVYNRGTEKRLLFQEPKDYKKFLQIMNNLKRIYHRGGPPKKYVSVVAYCLNPNHFHLLVKQKEERGVSVFLHRLCTAYTMYFNQKYQRKGRLFQGTYKAKHINTDAYLLWVTTYINGNAQLHSLVEDAKAYPWCSYRSYIDRKTSSDCEPEEILRF